MKKMPLQLVVWRDSHFDLDYVKPRKDFLVRTVGWVKREGRWLTIHSERCADGQYRAITRVPVENVVQRKVLH